MERALLAMPLVVLLTACGIQARTTATASPAATHLTQLTGTQLAAALVPGSAFPHEYRYDNSTSSDSGNRLETGPANYPLASVSCFDIEINFGQPGFGETAVAGNSYSTLVGNSTATSGGGAYGQTVYQFATTSAARSWWRALHSVLVRCPGIGLGSLRPGGSQRISAVQIPGTQAFRLDITIITRLPGDTIVTRVKTWIAVAGYDVFDVDALGTGNQVPANPAPATILRTLIARVLAAYRRPA